RAPRAPPSCPPRRSSDLTGRPKPLSAKPWPAIVNDAGVLARSIGVGLTPVTHSGHGRVSLTVSVMLPTSTQLPGPVWLYTCTCAAPAVSPGSGPLMLVAFVGKGSNSA